MRTRQSKIRKANRNPAHPLPSESPSSQLVFFEDGLFYERITVMENLKEIIEQECAKHVKGVRSQIRKMLEDSTLSLLGLSTGWSGGKKEIDHCNGRNSVLIDAFRECALEEAKKIARNYKPTPESIVGFVTTFQNEFNSALRSEIKKQAHDKAKIEAEKVVGAIKIDVESVIEKL